MIDQMREALWERLKSSWLPVTLVASLLSSVALSIQEANWVDKDQRVVQSLWLAVLLGWLWARSRFKGLFVTLYAVLILLVTALQVTAEVIPSPPAISLDGFWPWVNEMNLRWVKFALRAGGWVEILQSGKRLEDTGLFVILLVFLVWGSIFWLMWWMLRGRRVLLGMLPLAFWMAVNVNLSRQPLSYYFSFLMLAFLLIAHEDFYCRHRDWEARRVDYPDQLGIEWGLSAVTIALAALLVARLGTLVGTPEGWELISKWVRSTHQQTSERVDQWFVGVNTPPPGPGGGKPVLYASTPNLNEIGSPLPQGSDTIMWVHTSDPPPPPLEEYRSGVWVEEVKGHYWRSGVYDVYTGRGWEEVTPLSDRDPGGSLQPDEAAEPGLPASEGRYYLRQEYEVEAVPTGHLFAVNEPVNPGAGARLRAAPGDGGALLEGKASNYTVISAATRVTGDELAAASTRYPEEVRTHYLQIPSNLPARVIRLAERVAGEAATPFHKAILIQNYLRSNYPYNLAVKLAPPDRDVVDYFLFEQEEGFCSHYASAMVVMLRSQGAPARVVTGYATGSWNISRAAYQVTVSSAHAWVEVYFPGYGWVEFEPTAYQAPFRYPEIGRSSANAPAAGRAQPPKPEVSRFLLPALAVIALALVGLPFYLLRVFRAARGSALQQVNGLYRQMRRALGWAGLHAAVSVTPDEYLALYRQELSQYERLYKALRRATDLYRQASYSPHPPRSVDARIASDLWRSAAMEWIALWAKDRWRKLKSQSPH